MKDILVFIKNSSQIFSCFAGVIIISVITFRQQRLLQQPQGLLSFNNLKAYSLCKPRVTRPVLLHLSLSLPRFDAAFFLKSILSRNYWIVFCQRWCFKMLEVCLKPALQLSLRSLALAK